MTDISDTVLSLKNVEKSFVQENISLDVLKGICFELHEQEMIALTGASGTGKSTLLQIMGLLDLPTRGTVTVGHVEFSTTKARYLLHVTQRDRIRRQFLGFVYQYHHLLPELTALENVSLPRIISGTPKDLAEKQAKELLHELGLEERYNHTPAKLSGGEQQRVAIARALVNQPHIILADEPTGNLDDATTEHVFQLLLDLTQRKKIAIVVATHNLDLAKRMSKCFHLHFGKLEEITL
ncbi:lipoprotein-releasing system ATP-binding protein LolD [Alphaproteobacteria bacterium]|nr:lipoprotein-releasing system ATP-binding protein LolD [Alphaproteobacteria bacterium]GHS96148.1 lipoprotein-releasing system ATP-binding protein LolD [Alphaproteobacteria bacterium]